MAVESFIIPDNPEAEALLAPLAEPLEAAFDALGDLVGVVPPFRLRVEPSPHKVPTFDSKATLIVAPALEPRDGEGWHALYGLILEARARFAIAVRGNCLPDRLPSLEAGADLAWAGGGLYLARRCDGRGRWAESLLESLKSRPGESLLQWGRGGALYWAAVAEVHGHARTLDCLLAAVGSEAALRAPTFAEFMGERGMPWDVPLLKLVSGWAREVALPCPLVRGGVYDTPMAWRVYALPEVGPGHHRTLAGVGCRGRLNGRDITAPSPLEESGTLVLLSGPEGEGRVRVAASPLLGSWTLKGADFAGQVFGVRGLSVRFEGDGTLALDIGDAMVGPVTSEALGMASRVGVSGFAKGRWFLEGGMLRVRDLTPDDLSVHGRSSRAPMAWPAEDAKERAAFFAQQIQAIPWGIREVEDGILLEGRFGGIPASLRLGPDIPMIFAGVVAEA